MNVSGWVSCFAQTRKRVRYVFQCSDIIQAPGSRRQASALASQPTALRLLLSFFSRTMNQPAGISFAVIVNLRAEEWVVNSQKMVQKEDSLRGCVAFNRKVICAEKRDWRWF